MSKEKYEPRLTEIEELEKKGIELLPIEEMPPVKLKPNPNNKIFDPLSGKDYERLKEDIKERGIIDPLICDKSFTLLTGHNRLRIALELGLKEIPVRKIKSELSPKEEKKFLVLDNLLRRQLTYDEKIRFISMYYKEDLEKDNRGGNRKQKDNNELTPKKENVAEKIANDLKISKRQAERIASDIRKKSKPSRVGFDNPKPKKVTKSEPSKKDLQARLIQVRKEIKTLQAEEKKLKNQIDKMK
jgi:hypothetical protein